MKQCRENNIDFNRYIILENGEIISKFKNSRMTTENTANNYIINTFRKKDDKQETFSRHRVIWFYFNGEIPENMEIGHKDSNPKNNNITNLYLCTRKENMNNPITKKRMENCYKNVERNKKISENLKGRIVSENQKTKQSASMKGKNLGVKRPEHSKIMKLRERDNLGRWIKKRR